MGSVNIAKKIQKKEGDGQVSNNKVSKNVNLRDFNMTGEVRVRRSRNKSLDQEDMGTPESRSLT